MDMNLEIDLWFSEEMGKGGIIGVYCKSEKLRTSGNGQCT